MELIGAIIFFCILLGALAAALYLQRRKPARSNQWSVFHAADWGWKKPKRVVTVITLPSPVDAAPESQEARKEIDKRRALAIVRNLPRRKRRAFHAARRSGATVDQAIRDIRSR